MTDPGSYVYGVARGVDPATVTALSGVADSPVRVVAHGALTALVSTVDLIEFGEPGLRRNLEHLGWLEATARAHHAVLAAVALHGPVVPLRLATIYRGDDGVRALLAERGATFDAALTRVHGHTEWGLKVYLVPGADTAPTVQSPADTAAGDDTAGDDTAGDDLAGDDLAGDDLAGDDLAAPGTAYLRRRRARLQRSADLRHTAAQGAEAIHRAVSAAAAAARRYPPQDGTLTGESQEMVLNAAYLLAGTDRASLERALAQAGTWPLRVEWTGPWVPYSFVELEAES